MEKELSCPIRTYALRLINTFENRVWTNGSIHWIYSSSSGLQVRGFDKSYTLSEGLICTALQETDNQSRMPMRTFLQNDHEHAFYLQFWVIKTSKALTLTSWLALCNSVGKSSTETGLDCRSSHQWWWPLTCQWPLLFCLDPRPLAPSLST